MNDQESRKRYLNLVLTWIFWTTATGLTLSITMIDAVSRDWGVLVVLLVGGGITSSLIRSRYRLAEAISQVFRVGIEVGRQQREENERDHSQ